MDMADHDMPCADSSADCGVDLNYDGRNAQVKVKDAPDDSPIALLSFADLALDINLTHRAYVRPIQRHPPGPPPALNKLYCVYLK